MLNCVTEFVDMIPPGWSNSVVLWLLFLLPAAEFIIPYQLFGWRRIGPRAD
jgi:hypothetical protein